MIRTLGTVFAAVLGLAFGSFLNVCLSRWPEGESIIRPRSHCRNCGRELPWWENVPMVSWIALWGRCRGCSARISARYVIVEVAVGGLWAYAAWQSLPPSLDPSVSRLFLWYQLATAIAKMVLVWILVCLAILDAENLWLPDWITLPGIALGLARGILDLPLLITRSVNSGIPLLKQIEASRWAIYAHAIELVIAVAAAAVLILVIRWVYWLMRRREGIGLGDAKLMALLAAWLGFSGALLAFGIGVVAGAVFALLVLAMPRKPGGDWSLVKLPLGTFLCIGGIISSLWGRQIISAYLRWAGL
jgi:leader peptidase (prepilin peptidase)/N-methyltransferase